MDPIDDIEAKVSDAAEAAKQVVDSEEAPTFAEQPEVEVDALPPQRDEVIRAEERRRRRKRLLLRGMYGLVILALLAGVGYGVAVALERPEAEAISRMFESKTRKSPARPKQPTFYTFEDDAGVTHIVDSLKKVPKAYRARAKETR